MAAPFNLQPAWLLLGSARRDCSVDGFLATRKQRERKKGKANAVGVSELRKVLIALRAAVHADAHGADLPFSCRPPCSSGVWLKESVEDTRMERV